MCAEVKCQIAILRLGCISVIYVGLLMIFMMFWNQREERNKQKIINGEKVRCDQCLAAEIKGDE